MQLRENTVSRNVIIIGLVAGTDDRWREKKTRFLNIQHETQTIENRRAISLTETGVDQ